MNQTEDIKELVGALSKAQSVMKPAVFNKINPHFKSRYADFTSCMDACRTPLSSNGLSVMQYCDTIDGKLQLVTMIAHTSGQWIKSFFPLIPKNMDSQGIGSAMTYAKRYSLSSMLGIVSDEEDDDAETADGRGKNTPSASRPSHPKVPEAPIYINGSQMSELTLLFEGCEEAYLESVWKSLAREKITCVEEIPAHLYERLKNAALLNQKNVEKEKPNKIQHIGEKKELEASRKVVGA